MYVTTMSCFHRNTEHEKEYVLPAIQLTLRNLQLEYLDLYLFTHQLRYVTDVTSRVGKWKVINWAMMRLE